MKTRAISLSKKVLTALTILFCLGVTGCTETTTEAKVLHSSITYDGLQRTCRFYIPALYQDRDEAAPLVVALHGSGSTGDDMATCANFEDYADEQGFLVVWPDAYEENWNDGRAVAGIAAYDDNIDDVGFINALIDVVCANYKVDQSRIYLAGMSNGAMMTYRLACETPSRFAACAAVAGAIPENIYDACEPTVSMPFVVFNGTDDPYVPWDGGVCGTDDANLGSVVSVQNSILFWVDRNGCGTEPETTQMDDVDTTDGTTVSKYVFTGDDAEDDVVFYGIQGGGHTWPGGPAIQVLWDTGPVCFDIDATDIIWSFFSEHSRS